MKPLKILRRSEANQQYLAGYLPDRLRLVGNPKQQIAAFPVKQIKRVRIVHRADGYYCQVRRFGAYEIAPQEQEAESEITS